MPDKVMIFIDGANVFSSVREINEKIKLENLRLPANEQKQEKQIDYLKLINELSNGREIIRPYYFDGDKIPSTKEGFFNALRQSGINVITRPLREKELNCSRCNLYRAIKDRKESETSGRETIEPFNKSGTNNITFRQEYQKGVDVALVTEVLRMGRENIFDTAIIVSGDNDYKNALECVKLWGGE